MFAAFPLDLTLVSDPQVFLLPIQQPRLVRVLAARARDYDADIRWGHALAGFDQDRDGVTVRITGPDGPYDVRAQYLIGADGGSSVTRKLAGIEFPGMSSYDAVGRAGFDVLPPDEWLDPVGGGLDIPGYGRVPPLQFHRAERGVFAFGALGGRAALIMFEAGAFAQIDEVTVAAGRPVGEIAATAVLVRPDGYVAWASSAGAPDADELRKLSDALATWFGITAAMSS